MGARRFQWHCRMCRSRFLRRPPTAAPIMPLDSSISARHVVIVGDAALRGPQRIIAMPLAATHRLEAPSV